MTRAPDLDDGLSLGEGFAATGLSVHELWVRYLALGGSSTQRAFDRHLDSAAETSDHEHNLIAQTLNEAFFSTERVQSVAYRRLYVRP